jgi:hypothetical protein
LRQKRERGASKEPFSRESTLSARRSRSIRYGRARMSRDASSSREFVRLAPGAATVAA